MAGFHDFPFPMRSVIVFLHRNCTVGCDHCSARAVPDLSGGWHETQLKCLFKRLSDLHAPPYIVWTGGEPFLTPDLLRAAVITAGESGFHSEILTSGGILPPDFILDAIGSVPGTRLRISVDALHARHIPLECIARLAAAAEKSGMKVCFTLRDIPGLPPAADLLSRVGELIPGLFSRQRDSRFIHSIPHVPIQDPPSPGVPADPESPAPELPCRNGFQDLVVGEDRSLYPCCGAVSFADRDLLRLGYTRVRTGKDPPYSLVVPPLAELLQSRGPSGLAQALDRHPHSICSPPIEHPCRLCYALFRDCGNEIRNRFAQNPGFKQHPERSSSRETNFNAGMPDHLKSENR